MFSRAVADLPSDKQQAGAKYMSSIVEFNKRQNRSGWEKRGSEKAKLKEWLSVQQPQRKSPAFIDIRKSSKEVIAIKWAISYEYVTKGMAVLSFCYGDTYKSCMIKLDLKRTCDDFDIEDMEPRTKARGGKSWHTQKEYLIPENLLGAVNWCKKNGIKLLWTDFFNDSYLEETTKSEYSLWAGKLRYLYQRGPVLSGGVNLGQRGYLGRAWVIPEFLADLGSTEVDIWKVPASCPIGKAMKERKHDVYGKSFLGCGHKTRPGRFFDLFLLGTISVICYGLSPSKDEEKFKMCADCALLDDNGRGDSAGDGKLRPVVERFYKIRGRA